MNSPERGGTGSLRANTKPDDMSGFVHLLDGLLFLVQLSALQLFLAGDAVLGPRNCFEALVIDRFTAVGALAEVAFLDATQRHFSQVQETALLGALVEEEFLSGVGDRTVEGISLDAAVESTALLLGLLDAAA